jgi:hypothetical protein
MGFAQTILSQFKSLPSKSHAYPPAPDLRSLHNKALSANLIPQIKRDLLME